jgi:hypothetical protein
MNARIGFRLRNGKVKSFFLIHGVLFMKKLLLALTLATFGTSLCAMSNTEVDATVAESADTTVATDTDNAVVAAVEANVNAANATATEKAGAIAWIKNHKFLISAIVTVLACGTVGYIYKNKVSSALSTGASSVKSGLNTCGSYVADKATGAWTTCKENPKTSISATTAVVVIAAISADLLRGEKSWIKKFFSKKQEAQTIVAA